MSKKILIIGGTRNMGFYLAQRLAKAGCDLTLLNRGVTKDELPANIHRLHVDRSDRRQMQRALLAKSFDIVIDFVLYSQEEAASAINIFRDHVEHYIAVSSGQVYLVRESIHRPFSEKDYDGRLIPAPKENSYAYEEWRYGMLKRDVEDQLSQEWEGTGFPYTALRLPMVNSVRDQYHRLYNYYLRLRDGGVILVPETPNYALNHVYALDVVAVIMHLIESGNGKGQAYNIAQDEHVNLQDFLRTMADVMNVDLQLVRVKRSELEAQGFLPDCSPFSERWMSALDNSRSKAELGIRYTPLRDYLAHLVRHYQNSSPAPPLTFRRRRAELAFASNLVQH